MGLFAMVELANLTDVAEMESISRRFFDQMRYAETRGYVYDSEHIKDAITRIISGLTTTVTKYVRDGKIMGYMMMNTPTWSHLDSQPGTSFEMVWHGDPQLGAITEGRVMLSLLDDMLARLRNSGAKGAQISSENPSIQKALERRGFKKATTVHYVRF